MEDQPQPGVCTWLEPGLRRVLAPNPSPMTLWGTNSYLVGEGEVALIDPGPGLESHAEALLAALAPGERIGVILVTHSHRDHSSLAGAIAARTGAEVLAFGPSGVGRSPAMVALAESGLAGGGEGVDEGFAPTRRLADGEALQGPGWGVIEALHTPGHFGNHLCLAWGDRCFSGDHVMGWSSSLVSPPDGDMSDYMASLERLAARAWRVLHPGHGLPVTDPAGRLAWLARHRRERETQLIEALRPAPLPLPELTRRVYLDTPPALLPAAERNVLAHLTDLVTRGRVSLQTGHGPGILFALE